MDREVFDEIRDDFNEALPALIRGEPDRTDLMRSPSRVMEWTDTDKTIGPGEVKAAILEVYGITLAELYANIRHDDVVTEAKQMCAYVMVEHCDMTPGRAAQSMRRDRSTIVHSVKKITGQIAGPDVAQHLYRVLVMLGVVKR